MQIIIVVVVQTIYYPRDEYTVLLPDTHVYYVYMYIE